MRIIIKPDALFTFVFSLVLCLIVNYILGYGIQIFISLFVSIILTLCLFICVLIHELFHALVLWSADISIKSITLQWDGATIETLTKRKDIPLKIRFLSSLAGPISNIVVGLLLLLVMVFSNNSFVELFLLFLSISNLAIGLFNLLPISPLDGHLAVRSAVLLVKENRK